MLKKWWERVKMSEHERRLQQFYERSWNEPYWDDPLVQKIEWTSFSASFFSRSNVGLGSSSKLIKTKMHRLESSLNPFVSVSYFFGTFIFFVAAIVCLVMTEKKLIALGLFVISFAMVFDYVNQVARPIIFDKHLGQFWKGKTRPTDLRGQRLDQIHAILFLSVRSRTDKGHSYLTHQMILVLKDASRFLLMTNQNLEILYEQAAVLASFLGGLPLWDATD